MYLEERIEELEKLVKNQQNEINHLRAQGMERFYSPVEFARLTGCSEQLVYKQIRNGEIKTLKGLGTKKVIPMSQFYETELVSEMKEVSAEAEPIEETKKQVPRKKGRSLKELVFA